MYTVAQELSTCSVVAFFTNSRVLTCMSNDSAMALPPFSVMDQLIHILSTIAVTFSTEQTAFCARFGPIVASYF